MPLDPNEILEDDDNEAPGDDEAAEPTDGDDDADANADDEDADIDEDEAAEPSEAAASPTDDAISRRLELENSYLKGQIELLRKTAAKPADETPAEDTEDDLENLLSLISEENLTKNPVGVLKEALKKVALRSETKATKAVSRLQQEQNQRSLRVAQERDLEAARNRYPEIAQDNEHSAMASTIVASVQKTYGYFPGLFELAADAAYGALMKKKSTAAKPTLKQIARQATKGPSGTRALNGGATKDPFKGLNLDSADKKIIRNMVRDLDPEGFAKNPDAALLAWRKAHDAGDGIDD